MEKTKLNEIVNQHKQWLQGEGGARADLQEADLRWANLKGANLKGANLKGADLKGADLQEANLKGANLQEADLKGADLRWANLQEANLQEADLRWANLQEANLQEADLKGANLQEADLRWAAGGAIACPEEGAFIGFKKCQGGWIVKLEVLADAKRSSATGRKCRCDKARVLSITDAYNTMTRTEAVSTYDFGFVYRVGETVSVEDFCADRWDECAPGIHFFITRQEAVDYV